MLHIRCFTAIDSFKLFCINTLLCEKLCKVKFFYFTCSPKLNKIEVSLSSLLFFKFSNALIKI